MAIDKEKLKQQNILDVAYSMGMELERRGQNYVWKEHDSLSISPQKNIFSWFSQGIYGDVIQLVQTVKSYQTGREVSFKEASHYLSHGDFPTVDPDQVQAKPEPFSYFLNDYEQADFTKGRAYLKEERGLSDETIDLFRGSGRLVEASKRLGKGFEPVLVFKYLDGKNQLLGASLQGIEEHQELYDRGRLKQIMKNSDGNQGFSLDIGKPNRLVFAESPIDLMSYVQMKGQDLQNVRLVAMDGLKEGVISRHVFQLKAELDGVDFDPSQLKSGRLAFLAHNTDFFKQEGRENFITLAVDNDPAGRRLVSNLQEKGIPVFADLPPLEAGQEKMDWNDYLKSRGKEISMTQEKPDNSRLAQARRKAARLENEFNSQVQKAFDHTAQTNGQPMNDKRGAASFFRQQERIEDGVFSKLDELNKQKERVARLEEQAERQARGLNKQGTGLEMSVRNIPKIRAEIDKFERGESHYTAATIKRYRRELEKLEAMAKVTEGSLSPGARALIEGDQLKQWQKKPTIYFVKGKGRFALELTDQGNFIPSPKYRPQNEEERDQLQALLAQQDLYNQKGHQETMAKTKYVHQAIISDTELSRELYKKNYPSLEACHQALAQAFNKNIEQGYDGEGYFKTDILVEFMDQDGQMETLSERMDVGFGSGDFNPNRESLTSYLTESFDNWLTSANVSFSSLEEVVEETKKAPEQSREQSFDRTSGSTGVLQLEAEGSAEPVLETSTFERSVTSRPTSSYPYLHFSTNFAEVQRRLPNYSPVTPADLKRLNQYAPSIQSTAQWYMEELANSKISYIYLEDGQENLLEVNFQKENFCHLTGIRPVEEGKQAADFVDDFVRGQGHFDGMLVSNAVKSKLQVLPMLRDIVDSKSFVLDDLTSVSKLHQLNMTEAIKSKEEDFLVLFKDTEQGKVPASLMRLKGKFEVDVKGLGEKIILGVYRERNGVIEQLSVNTDVIKDDGKEMLAILENRQYEELTEPIKVDDKPVQAEDFTRVLDAVYNVGVPDNFDRVPEEFLPAWDLYKDYANRYNHDLDKIVAVADKDGLLDKSSYFFQDWVEDHVDASYHRGQIDSDGDGLTDAEEYSRGTNPYSPDNNGNGIPDREEPVIKETPQVPSLSQAIQKKDSKVVSKVLEETVKTYTTPEGYQNFLTASGKFHNYSSKNIQLLLAQNPNVSQVASFKKWKDDFERTVKKGEKALYIFVPYQYKLKDDNGNYLRDDQDQILTGTGFKLAPVFDISQTEGKEISLSNLPQVETREEHLQLFKALKQVGKDQELSLQFGHLDGEAKSHYNPHNHSLTIQTGLSHQEALHVLIKGSAYASLSDKGTSEWSPTQMDRLADSVAYAVASRLGMDTTSYDFSYLDKQATDPASLKKFEQDLQAIQQETKTVIQKLETAFSRLKAQSQVNPFSDSSEKKTGLDPQKEVAEKKEQAKQWQNQGHPKTR